MKNTFFYSREDRLNLLLERDKTHASDVERKSLFYIIAGNGDLYNKADLIYDFNSNSIRINCLDDGSVDFCSGSRSLVKLAFNLYNGFIHDNCDPLNILSSLDDKNFELALEAIRIRFNKGFSKLNVDVLI